MLGVETRGDQLGGAEGVGLVRKVGICRGSVAEADIAGAVWRLQEMAELWAFILRWAHEGATVMVRDVGSNGVHRCSLGGM